MKNGWVLHRCDLHKPNATNILKEWLVYPGAEMVDTFIQDNPKKWGSKTQHSIHSSVFHCFSFSRHLYHFYGKSIKGKLFYIFTSISLHHQKHPMKTMQNVLLISYHQRVDESAELLPLILPFHRSDYPNRCAPLCWSPESILPRHPPLISTPTNTSWRSLPGAPPGWRKASEIISQHLSHQSRKSS